ncbi:MAG: PEP-CTERM sorting domain-containing protein [Peristeroidobacter soli]
MKLTTKKWTTAAAIAVASLCGTANAGSMTWTDTVNLTPAPLLTAFTPTSILTYTHFLEDFNTATDSVDSFTLTFNLYDDGDRESEFAVAGSLLGNSQIENFGSLTVAVAALWGDFYVGGSTLTVNGQRKSVPEPGTRALFGAALMGFGLMRRKRETV